MDLPVPVNVAVMCVGTDDAALNVVVDRLGSLGHRVVEVQRRASGDPVLEVFSKWIDDPEIDVVIAVASDTDPVRAAISPLITRSLPGFGELLRIAAFGEIGSSAMTLDAEAARCGSTYLFVLPAAVGAVKVALDRLLIPQLDLRTRPTSLAAKLPRLRAMVPPADAFDKRPGTDPGVAPAPQPAPSRTVPPAPPPRTTPPLGVVLRAPAGTDSGDIPLLNSDAAIPIQPAVIVDDKEPVKAEEPAVAVPRTSTDELAPEQVVEATPQEPAAAQAADATAQEPASQALTSDNVGAFVRSLEAHAKDLREKSQVGPLPRAPGKTEPPRAPGKTEPPPLPKKTDAELKAARDAAVTEAISHVGPRPEPAKPKVEAAAAAAAEEEPPAPPRRTKNITTRAEWEKAADAISKQSTKAPEPTLAELDKRAVAVRAPKKGRGALLVPLLLGVAAAGGYVVKTQLASNGTASAQPQPQPQPQQVAVAQPPPAPEQAAPPPVEPEPEVVIDVSDKGSSAPAAPTLTSVATHHHTGSAAPVAHETESDTGSDAGSAAPVDPRTHPNIAPASPDCDETSCILEKYARECCARYKPAEMPVDKVDPPKPAGPPDTLDKAAVKAGIADVKPAVQQCGEDHYHAGEVKITLTVGADGAVTDATVADSPDPELGKCVAGALRRATFAKTQNGAVFTYPFAF
jgi:molybdenum cofactor biosynthesis protein B